MLVNWILLSVSEMLYTIGVESEPLQKMSAIVASIMDGIAAACLLARVWKSEVP